MIRQMMNRHLPPYLEERLSVLESERVAMIDRERDLRQKLEQLESGLSGGAEKDGLRSMMDGH